MRRRFRQQIGASEMIAIVPVYALVATALAQARPVREAAVFYCVLTTVYRRDTAMLLHSSIPAHVECASR
jgi:hypothetical protein